MNLDSSFFNDTKGDASLRQQYKHFQNLQLAS